VVLEAKAQVKVAKVEAPVVKEAKVAKVEAPEAKTRVVPVRAGQVTTWASRAAAWDPKSLVESPSRPTSNKAKSVDPPARCSSTW